MLLPPVEILHGIATKLCLDYRSTVKQSIDIEERRG